MSQYATATSSNDEVRAARIVEHLLNDSRFSFRDKGRHLEAGVCPQCQKKELFISKAQPWQLMCNRRNNCGYIESTRVLLPEIFDQYEKRFEQTPADPHAAAKAYLEENRGFNVARLAGMYSQERCKVKNGNTFATVRFPLWDNHYWERLLDLDAVKANEGKKANISWGCQYAGRAWQPTRQAINNGDTVWITEGIFKSIALIEAGQKSISAISCSNIPTQVIEAHKDKNITWVIALDNDAAGVHESSRWLDKLTPLKQNLRVALPQVGEDWDDVHRLGRLDEQYLSESFWRGRVATARGPKNKAFWLYVKKQRHYDLFEYGNALWRMKVDGNDASDVRDAIAEDKALWLREDEYIITYQSAFAGALSLERISNAAPEFLYIDRNPLTEEQQYFFRFRFANGSPAMQIALDASAVETPAGLNKALLGATPGGSFSGNPTDMKYLHERWFDQRPSYVETVPFIGYYKESEVYVFGDRGFYKGRRLMVNKQGFMECGQRRFKSGLKSLNLLTGGNFNPAILTDLHQAYGLNALGLLSWWTGTLFAEQIRALCKFWTFCEYTGDPGAGKSTQIEFLWRCCGRDYEGFDPNKATYAGRARAFSQVGNLPVVLIEGDRSDGGAKKAAMDLDELKTLYNGGTLRAMGVKNQGSETYEPQFRGGILISQNATVDGSDALLERIVHFHCTPGSQRGIEAAAFKRLTRYPMEQVAGLLEHILKLEPQLLEHWQQQFEAISARYMQAGGDGLKKRIAENHAQVAAWGYCLPLIFGPQQMPPALCQQLEEHLFTRCMERQRRLQADDPLVEQFWELYELLHEKSVGEPNDPMDLTVEVLNHSADPQQIAINLNHFTQVCDNARVEKLPVRELKKRLPGCTSHRFLGIKTVRSQILGKSVHCWIFEANSHRQ